MITSKGCREIWPVKRLDPSQEGPTWAKVARTIEQHRAAPSPLSPLQNPSQQATDQLLLSLPMLTSLQRSQISAARVNAGCSELGVFGCRDLRLQHQATLQAVVPG